MYIVKCLNNVQSRLIVHGDIFGDVCEVIVVITGCPGILEFYEEFAEQLYRSTGLPVCVVGHAGQDNISAANDENNNGCDTLFNLQGQMKHKLDLINNYINKNSRIHLIGHSIGAWMLLEVLDGDDHLIKRASSIQLLFPTLQKVASAPMAAYVKLLRLLHNIIIFILTIFQCLPKPLQIFLADIYLKLNSLPENYVNRILTYLDSKVEQKAMTLAYEAMDTVITLNLSAIDKVRHLTSVMYSRNDHWVPLKCIEDLKKYAPQLHFVEVNADHAFVMKSSGVVANRAAEIINNLERRKTN